MHQTGVITHQLWSVRHVVNCGNGLNSAGCVRLQWKTDLHDIADRSATDCDAGGRVHRDIPSIRLSRVRGSNLPVGTHYEGGRAAAVVDLSARGADTLLDVALLRRQRSAREPSACAAVTKVARAARSRREESRLVRLSVARCVPVSQP